jgi:hypothetical protein
MAGRGPIRRAGAVVAIHRSFGYTNRGDRVSSAIIHNR